MIKRERRSSSSNQRVSSFPHRLTSASSASPERRRRASLMILRQRAALYQQTPGLRRSNSTSTPYISYIASWITPAKRRRQCSWSQRRTKKSNRRVLSWEGCSGETSKRCWSLSDIQRHPMPQRIVLSFLFSCNLNAFVRVCAHFKWIHKMCCGPVSMFLSIAVQCQIFILRHPVKWIGIAPSRDRSNVHHIKTEVKICPEEYVNVFSRGNHKVEDACEMYARAANMFKMAKNWSGMNLHHIYNWIMSYWYYNMFVINVNLIFCRLHWSILHL